MPYKDRETYLSSQRGYYKKDPETYKWRARLNRHGLTKENFMQIVSNQDNKCALCRKPFEGLFGKDCHIDHCHETNRVRGLLCMPCNVGLGMLGDNVEGLKKAINYIEGKSS